MKISKSQERIDELKRQISKLQWELESLDEERDASHLEGLQEFLLEHAYLMTDPELPYPSIDVVFRSDERRQEFDQRWVRDYHDRLVMVQADGCEVGLNASDGQFSLYVSGMEDDVKLDVVDYLHSLNFEIRFDKTLHSRLWTARQCLYHYNNSRAAVFNRQLRWGDVDLINYLLDPISQLESQGIEVGHLVVPGWLAEVLREQFPELRPEGFNPARSFDSVEEAMDYCAIHAPRTDAIVELVKSVAAHNRKPEIGEEAFADELETLYLTDPQRWKDRLLAHYHERKKTELPFRREPLTHLLGYRVQMTDWGEYGVVPHHRYILEKGPQLF